MHSSSFLRNLIQRLFECRNVLNFHRVMAYQTPNSRQDVQNRKILEDLLMKKQMLLKQGVMPTLSPTAINAPVMPPPTAEQQMNIMQRNAQSLIANSNTFYVTTDSTFGNHILPVIPRLENAHPK
ncbi:SOSS complex subunit C homolog [Thrips palmi]|uniref:SOSS complex subunit C homolog n=1 Tax=Thrips palmi TaxID=161013 RepID=A0A6P8YLH0_THRPL|nr:SOSS complex subunit C homolog [Thrips palmi]